MSETEDQQKHWTGPELRAMITARQRELEEIAIRCAQSNYEAVAEIIAEACGRLVTAKTRIARVESKDRP